MRNIEKALLDINDNIDKNLEKINEEERGFFSQNILNALRNYVEHIALLIYSEGKDIDISYENIKKAIKHIKSKGEFKFLNDFHYFLQIVASHYTVDKESAERLMLKYYEYLLKIKAFLKEKFHLDVLKNISKFPINIDTTIIEYHKKIVEKINRQGSTKNERYYIQKIKPFFIENKVYYEVTFTMAKDNVSKFDRLIAYTKHDIPLNYAVKLWLRDDSISILGKDIPIKIIEKWEVSIRQCELENFAKIFGFSLNIKSSEYKNLMDFLTKTNYNFVDLITTDNYEDLKTEFCLHGNFIKVLDKSRELVINNSPGSNIIRYLLYGLRNKIIKEQYNVNDCGDLSNLKLKYGCIPFDQMPFCTSLVNHNPPLSDLFDCLDTNEREHEFLARVILNNTEIKGQLYTKKNEIEHLGNIDELVKKHNSLLYKRHRQKRSINIEGDILYISGYESDTIEIIDKIKKLSEAGIKGYKEYVQNWLSNNQSSVDCEQKKEILISLFEKTRVAIIYGAAGTGKSTLINHISQIFNEQNKLYLAVTNSAVDNLKRKVKAANSNFSTITKFLLKNGNSDYDLLFIDECSTVSNLEMIEILNKANFKLLILVGDDYQIESIRFGNWFAIIRHFLSPECIFELKKPYRTKNEKLLNLWEKVRNLDSDILEHLVKEGYTKTLDQSIFSDIKEEDEIVLALNYDGFYGINNLNSILQANNKNQPVYWGDKIFKVGDPILFNETKRFGPAIYNNLKGKIVNIKVISDKIQKIQFDIEVYKSINELEIKDCELIKILQNGHSIIRFSVNKHKSTDEEDDESASDVIPFQIAYAVSIHKAQGLEYDSVKIVISSEVDELITHNIFYTAITRVREKLKIYWTPETEKKVLSKISKRDIGRDLSILKSKIGVKDAKP